MAASSQRSSTPSVPEREEEADVVQDEDKSEASLPPSERLFSQSSDASQVTDPTVASKSSANLSSDDLIDFNQETDERPPDEEVLVHGHSLPKGWDCTYDSQADHYKFEYHGQQGAQPPVADVSQLTPLTRPTQDDPLAANNENLVARTRDEAVLAKTPTMDHEVQTSRRLMSNLYECKYGYHFPTSPTSSMISELAKEVQKQPAQRAPKGRQISYGKTKLVIPAEEEEQARRLREMFPTATGPVIEQMIRIYHGREGLIKAALISLGYKRATEYGARQQTAQSPIMLMMSKPSSKKLYEKLAGYFPEKDEALIKRLMYKHKEVEHDIISALVESSGGSDSEALAIGGSGAGGLNLAERDGPDRTGVIMKLRYLKYLFPDCKEIELYHLLHCNNLNAQLVRQEMERRGHKPANIDELLQNRKSQSQQMRAQQAALAAKDKAPQVDPVEAHRKRVKPVLADSRIANLKESLKKKHPAVEEGLLLRALEAADYSESLAAKFLADMKPVDEALYKKRYEFKRELGPNVVLFPCKGVQKEAGADEGSFMAVTADDHVAIGREVIECKHALALLKVEASTSTRDDFERLKFSHAQGRQLGLAAGSKFGQLEVRDSLRRGPQAAKRQGSQYGQVCADPARARPNGRALGRQATLAQGHQPIHRCGHNPRLLQRIHPFYLTEADQ